MHSQNEHAKDLITIKVNPTNLLSLFMLPIAYDVEVMAAHAERVMQPIAYEVSFDEYVKFIALETVSKSETNNLFLASDSVLNSYANKILPLIHYLGDGKPETLAGRNFSCISEDVQKALAMLYSNFILNMTMLQIKMIEFLRWDPNKGTYVAYIIPTLGVFEALKNIGAISFEHVEVDRDIELSSVTKTVEYDVPSNIFVGHLNREVADYLFEETEPRLMIDSYLYKGIYKYSQPKGKILPEQQRAELERKYKAKVDYEKKISDAQTELDIVLTNNNTTKLNKSEFLNAVLALAQQYNESGTLTSDKLGHLTSKPSVITKISNQYNTLMTLITNPDRPVELTEKEQRQIGQLLELDTRQKTSWRVNNTRLVDRYPIYCYYELISKLDNKVYDGLELEPLEDNILKVDKWINHLLRLLDVCEDLYYKYDEVYLLSYELSQVYTDESNDVYKLEGYNLTTVLP